MIFELLHSPYPEGYGEKLLPLDACKVHLKIDGDDEDDLIAALRDAAVQVVELYCSIKLLASDVEWRGSSFPRRAGAALPLSVAPVTAIETISWRSATGDEVDGLAGGYRITGRGDVLPAIGGEWPSDVGGDIIVKFKAGYAQGAAPPALLTAVRLFLGHLYKNREAVTDRGTEAEIPFGVRQICAPFCRVLI
ncbi:head-tail connector protein [uncultured Novosphingobium sp.]|uniref:head-tail connector protein n=1 Tax=uncultured Novosphingobium sp. TaxID=292277 RepID=UPI0037492AFC